VLKSSYIVVTMLYRGDDFRKAFSKIDCMTATATKETLDVVTE